MKKVPGMYIVSNVIHCLGCGYHGQQSIQKGTKCLVCNQVTLVIRRGVWQRVLNPVVMKMRLLK